MRVAVTLCTRPHRRWHQVLVRSVAELPEVAVGVRWRPPSSDPDRALEALLRLERLLHRLPEAGLAVADADPLADLVDGPEHDADVVLDLTESPEPGSWRVTYDGVPGESAAVAALGAGRFPLVEVRDGSGAVRAVGRPGSEQPGLLATTMPDVAAGVTTLVLGALRGRDVAAPLEEAKVSAGGVRSAWSLMTRRSVGALLRLGYRVLYRAPHWRVGWRPVSADPTIAGTTLPAGWHDLPDDGLRFYADPFLFEHDGRTYLFVEDYEHRLGKGVISVVERDANGFVGTPRPVLRHEVHLSYPLVLAHDGEIWMIPETSQARTVELYRATRFPDEWTRESILIDGAEISDATPFEHGGRWWLTATVGHGGSLSDSLHLWSAPDLRGPWHPHRANPVLVDIASARPAGHVVEHEGRLLRPVQDCRNGYGAALAVAEITRLDDDAFEQRVVAQHAPGGSWPGRRLHTLNATADLEVVDGSGMAPRFTPRRQRR